MRGATVCARKLKQGFKTLRTRLGKAPPLPSGDPISQLILGIFTRDAPEAKANDVLDRLRAVVVDYNELRVIPPLELVEVVGDYSDARLKCEDLSRALNRIFAIEHTVSLDRLAQASMKETVAYLNGIDGLEPYTRARIRQFGLRQHAIPLDEAMWALARRGGYVDERATLEEAQAFMERQIPAKDGPEFVALLRKQAWSEMATAVRKREVERILSVPPDRTARNMLRAVSAAAASGAVEDADSEIDESLGALAEVDSDMGAAIDPEGSSNAAPNAPAAPVRKKSARRASAAKRKATPKSSSKRRAAPKRERARSAKVRSG